MGIFGGRKLDPFSMMGVQVPPGYMGGQGFGDGMIERQQMPQMGGYDQGAAMQGKSGFAPMNQGAPQKKPGFFSKDGGWRDLAGAFGDVFSPNGPVYFPQKQRQNELMQRQQMAEQQRMQEREDFIWKSQYDRANPKSVNNDTVNDLNWYKSLSEEDRKLFHQMKPVVSYMADGTPRVINPYDTAPKSGPSIGAIEDGHEFIGGDPANPASWKKVGGSAVIQPSNFR